MKSINFKKQDLDNLTTYNTEGFEGSIYIYSQDLLVKIFDDYLKKIMDIKIKKYKLMNLKEKNMPEHMMIVPDKIVNIDGEFGGYTMPKIEDSILISNINDFRKLIKIFRCLFKHLEVLHENDIIVNDIKAENILLHKNQDPIFIDVDSMGVDQYPPDYPNKKTNFYKRVNNLNQKLAYNDFYTLDKLKLLLCFLHSVERQNEAEIIFNSLHDVLWQAEFSDEFKNAIDEILNTDQELEKPLEDINDIFLYEEMQERKRRRK